MTVAVLFAATVSFAQSRSCQLTVQVVGIEGERMLNQPVQLTQTDYAVGYGTLKLGLSNKLTVKVYPGNHMLTIDRDGFDHFEGAFNIPADATEYTYTAQLTESSRAPYSITATNIHDIFTGRNDIALMWNTEKPVFFDDFESYPDWSISFGEWTGIDGDLAATAPLAGTYPNRGVTQYAQIINPLTVEPTWWYDYPILHPYSGQQYCGFIRTSTGTTNDDWLISPAITPGTDNILSFLAKAADIYDERFMVYVTEQTDNPTVADFTRIDQGNYESVDYRGWHKKVYDLSDYAGKTVKFAIRYISDANRYGAFMLMVDDVYVGPAASDPTAVAAAPKARMLRRSPANPYEKFEIYLDDTLVGTTEDYTYTLTDVPGGDHTVGLRSIYRQAQSDIVTVPVTVNATDYAAVTFHVTADSKLSPDGTVITLADMTSTQTHTVHVADGQAVIPSLPYGQYSVSVEAGAYQAYESQITVDKAMSVDIALTDNIIDPYNVTANVDESGNLTVRWNQSLGFTDSFEDYPDFITGYFGGWLSYNLDNSPCYPIQLNGSIITFPGGSTQFNPMPVAPMVFNPWNTTPAMLPTDQAVAAPTGDKTVIFFSAQQAVNNKWLITPPVDLYDNYVLRFTAKGYSSAYPESMQIGIASAEMTDPYDFEIISQVPQLTSEGWTIYEVDLAEYAGYSVRLGFNYTSYDAFMAQIDDVSVEPADGAGELIDYGNVDHYEIYLDGKLHGTSPTAVYEIAGLPQGEHTVGIRAIYKSGASQTVTVTVSVTDSVTDITADGADTPAAYYNLQGMRLNGAPDNGVYITVKNGKAVKTIAK